MTLLERIQANQCRVQTCANDKAQDSDVCRDDLTEKWMHRLDRQPDGTYIRRRQLAARDLTGWVKAA